MNDTNSALMHVKHIRDTNTDMPSLARHSHSLRLTAQAPPSGRQHAGAEEHRLHEQPRPTERGLLPHLQPAGGLAVGRGVLRDHAGGPPRVLKLGQLAQCRWAAERRQTLRHLAAIQHV